MSSEKPVRVRRRGPDERSLAPLTGRSAAPTPETLSVASVQSALRRPQPADNPPPRTPKKSPRRMDPSPLTVLSTTKATADPSRRKMKSPVHSDASSDDLSTTGSQRSSAARRAASAASDLRGRGPRLPDIKESRESAQTNSIDLKVDESNAQHKQEEVKLEVLASRAGRPKRVPSGASAASKRCARRWSDAQESAHFFSSSPLHAISDTTRAAIETVMRAGSRLLGADRAAPNDNGSEMFAPFRIKEPRSNEGVKKQRPVKNTTSAPSEEAKQQTSAGGLKNQSSHISGPQRQNTAISTLTNNDFEAPLGPSRRQRTIYDWSAVSIREEEPTVSEEPTSVKVVRGLWSPTVRARSLPLVASRAPRPQDESPLSSRSTSSLLFMEVQAPSVPDVARSVASLVIGANDSGAPSSKKKQKDRSKTRLKLFSSSHTLSLSVSTCSTTSPADALSLKTDSLSSRDTGKSISAGQKTPKSVRLNDKPIDDEPPLLVREALLPKEMKPRSITPTGELARASQSMFFRRELFSDPSLPPKVLRATSMQDVQRVFSAYEECPLCKLANQCYHLPRVNALFPMFRGRRSMAAGTGTRVELHAHLAGSVRHETIWELMKLKNLELPGDGSLRAMRDALISKISVESVHYLEHIPIYLQAIASDVPALERLAFEFCEDKVKQGVLYAEARYVPHLLVKNKKLNQRKLLKELSKVVMAVNRGFKIAESELGITVRSILCIVIGMDIAKDIIRLCERFQNDGVVGIDLILPCVLGENNGSFVLYEEVPLIEEELRDFETATTIKRTVHAGQAGSANMVERAVDKHSAQRLGHGYEVLKKPSLYAKCREQGVHFECCPWDSLLSGAVHSAVEKHPVARFAEDGVNFGLNNSHPTLTGITLQEVYDLTTSWGLTEAHIVRANINALRSSFLPGEQKEQLMQTLLENLGIKRRRSKE